MRPVKIDISSGLRIGIIQVLRQQRGWWVEWGLVRGQMLMFVDKV